MQKILILANSANGVYNFRRKLIEQFIADGNQVCVASPANEVMEKLAEIGCKCIETPMNRRGMNPIKDFDLLMLYRGILKKEKPDMVITYTIKPNIYGGVAARFCKVPYAVNITGLGTAFQKKGALMNLVVCMYQMALKKAKVVFFENSENMRIFQELKLCPSEKCKLLNGAGVDLEHFAYEPYPNEATVHFLFIGRVMREKGVNELLEATKRLSQDGGDCILDIVGDFEEDYRDTFAKYEEEGWLNYHGRQADVRPFIKNAHCFVLPSWHEGMANTNLECAASGRPLITSSIPGCREAVEDGVSGFLCEKQNADSLYQAMKRVLELSQPDRETMGKAGRERMEEVFDKRKVVAETIRALT